MRAARSPASGQLDKARGAGRVTPGLAAAVSGLGQRFLGDKGAMAVTTTARYVEMHPRNPQRRSVLQTVELLREGRADLIAFGRPFISNPDLVERLRRGARGHRGRRPQHPLDLAPREVGIHDEPGTLGDLGSPRGQCRAARRHRRGCRWPG